MPTATVERIIGLYQEILADDDFVLEESKRADAYDRMKRDSHVFACWQSRVIPVACAPWQIESESTEQADVLTEQIKNFPRWPQYCQAILDAIWRGYSGWEYVFAKPGGACIVQETINIGQDYLVFDRQGLPRLLTTDKPYDGIPMPSPQFGTASWGEVRHGDPRGKSVGQAVFWPWFFKHKGIKFWARALEKFGMPSLKATVKSANLDEKIKRVKKIFRDYVGGAGIVLEDGDEAETIGEVGNLGAAHKQFLEYFDGEISKDILGNTLTHEAPARGSYALGKVQADVQDAILWADTIWLAEIHSRVTLAILGGLLFGDAYKPAKFSYIWENPEEGQIGAERLKALKEVRLPMRKSDVYEIAGVPEPVDGDDLFEWPAAPAPVMPGSLGGGDEEQEPPEEFAEKRGSAARMAQARKDQGTVDDLSLAATVKAVQAFRAKTLPAIADRLKKKIESGETVRGEDLVNLLDLQAIERLYIDTMFTAYLTGAAQTTAYVEKRGVDLPRPETFAEFQGDEPVDPAEAIRWIEGRAPLPLKRLEGILDTIKDGARGNTQTLVDTIARKIDEKLVSELRQGASLDEFLKNLDGVADAAGLTKADPFYWETVFRTNTQTAYGAGREEIMDNPVVKEAFGYVQYLTVDDSAVRPEHAALHEKVFKEDSAEAKAFWPPLGFNCRCIMVPISREEIEDEGLEVSDKAPDLREGYERLGLEPPDDSDRPVAPAEGFEGRPSERFGLREEVPAPVVPEAPKEQSVWKPAKTIEEAEKFAIDNLFNYEGYSYIPKENLLAYLQDGGAINLKGVPVDVTNSFNKAFFEMKKKHGLQGLSAMRTSTVRGDSVAEFITKQGVDFSLRINGEFLRKITDQGITLGQWQAAANADGFLAGKTVEDLAYHEAVHYYHRGKLKDNPVIQKLYEWFSDRGKSQYISRYADTNAAEFFAEFCVKVKNDGLESILGPNHSLYEAVKEILP